MLQQALTISFCTIAIYVSCFEGHIFGKLKAAIATEMDYVFGKAVSKYVQKPIWSCLPCMGSIWTMVISWSFSAKLILCVVGMNCILCRFINPEDE